MSIQKNDNIYKHHYLKRVVEHKGEQINFLDQRFYKTENGEYYPSVTSVLNFYPKNKFFESWLKDVSHNSDIIVRKAAEEGTTVHESIEKFLDGEEIKWMDENGRANFSLDVWKMILRFSDFWKTIKPELLASEIHLLNHDHKYAGTCDLVVKIDGKIWLLDIKTSNSLHTSYNLQLSAYAEAWNSYYPEEKIEHVGIIWLKSSKRGKKEGKIQGDGWEIIQPDKTIDEYFRMFMNIYEIYLLENPYQKPLFESFPTTIKLT
jgi:ATP-dependent exoDNAse (exonuclease V) beta subunit